MEFIFNSLPCFIKRQHEISEWLAKLEQRFILADNEDYVLRIFIPNIFSSREKKGLFNHY